MLCPPYLKCGDKVAVVAPARKISPEEISKAVDVISSWGLIVTFSEDIFDSYHQFAGNDSNRTYSFQKTINDCNIKAIFCARGGYGCLKIIDSIDFFPLLKNPKWIIGFSDITVIHAKLNAIGIESMHAPVLSTFESNTKSCLLLLKDVLFGNTLCYNYDNINKLNINGKSEGEIIGGNLSIIYSLAGSNNDFIFNNKILFIEDLDEYLYHIDRMMISLKRAGKLANLNGIVVGDVSNMNDNAIPFGKNAEEIIYDTVKEYKYPVAFNFPSGHINNNNPLILGRRIILSVDDNAISISFSTNK